MLDVLEYVVLMFCAAIPHDIMLIQLMSIPLI